jgi:hypothetical protein
MKPRVSDNVRDRNTAAIGSFAKCLTSKGGSGAGGAVMAAAMSLLAGEACQN